MLDPHIKQILSQVSTATLSTQLFSRGLRNTFLTGLFPLNKQYAHFVGEAFTLRYIPAREDIDKLDVFQDYDHPQRLAVESADRDQVLVMDCRGDIGAASAGHILVTRMMMRGLAGLVTDGALRDTPAIASTKFPSFCAGACATTNLALHHAVDMQVPIGCAGVPVFPGDIIVADEEGVICIPKELATEIAEPALAQERMEDFILSEIESGKALKGIYPPNEETRQRYMKLKG